jgi:putative DNA primase/helicase
VILTNEVPRFTDASGALASRFIVLVLTNTFLGREDPALTDTVLAESPGIFNWALDGLDRLLARGYFEQPAVSRDAMQRLEDLASPVSAFVPDRCVIDPIREIGKDDLWAAWKDWCMGEGKDRASTKAVLLPGPARRVPRPPSNPAREGRQAHPRLRRHRPPLADRSR